MFVYLYAGETEAAWKAEETWTDTCYGEDGFEWQGTELRSLRTALAGISGLAHCLLLCWAPPQDQRRCHTATWGWRLWNESLLFLCWIELHLPLSGRLCRLGIWNHLYVLISLARENNSSDQQGCEHRNIEAWVCLFFFLSLLERCKITEFEKLFYWMFVKTKLTFSLQNIQRSRGARRTFNDLSLLSQSHPHMGSSGWIFLRFSLYPCKHAQTQIKSY